MFDEIEQQKRQDEFEKGLQLVPGFFADFMAKGRARKKFECIEPPYKDHRQLFQDRKTKELIYTIQPYIPRFELPKASDEEILNQIRQASEQFARQHGLTVEMSMERSWHFPGETVLIVYRKK